MTVTMPDGTLVEMPEQVSPAQAQALRKLLPKEAPDTTLDVLKGVGGGTIQGLTTGMDLGTMALKAVMTPPKAYPSGIPGGENRAERMDPRAWDYGSKIKLPSQSLDEAGMIPHAVTGLGKYAQEITAGGVGALSFPGGSIVPKVAVGMGAGAGGELAANTLEDKPWARVAGAVASTLPSYGFLQLLKLAESYRGGPSTQTARIVSDAAKGTSEAELARAAETQAAGKAAGVDLTPIQGLERPQALHGLQEKAIANSPDLAAVIAKQNPAAAGAANRFLGEIAPPGEPAAVATRAQGAAEGAIEKARKFATEGTKPYYELLQEDVPYSLVKESAARMREVVKESPAAREFLKHEVLSKITRPIASNEGAGQRGWMVDPGVIPGEPEHIYKGGLAYIAERANKPGTYDAINETSTRVIASGTDIGALKAAVEKQLGSAKTTGFVSVGEIQGVLNEAKTKLNAPMIGDKGIDRHVAGKIRTSLDELENIVTAASANRPLGHQVYADIYDRIVNPMKAGLTGKIAGVKGVVDDAVPPTTRILGELNAPTVRAESIQRLAKDMTRVDPGAFPALVRGTWEQNLEKAFAGGDQASPAKFAAALRGSPEQAAKRENFRATIAEVARANGLSQRGIDEAVVGAEKFMSVMEAAGRAKGGMAAAPPAQGGPVENLILRAGPGMAPAAGVRWLDRISDMMNRKAYGEIAEALTSPDGMTQMREWAKFDIGKYRLSGVSGGVAGVTTQAKER